MIETTRGNSHDVTVAQDDDVHSNHVHDETKQGFSHFIAVCFTVNYIVGTGFLTIPWAFQQGGIVLSLLTLGFVGFISNITKNYLLQSMALAEAILTRRTEENNVDLSLQIENYGSVSNGSVSTKEDEISPLVAGVHDPARLGTKRKHNDMFEKSRVTPSATTTRSDHLVKRRKFEVLDLVRLYLGERIEKLLIVTIALDVSMELWAFTSVFSSSFAEELPMIKSFSRDYDLYTALFAIIVVPLSCLELKEQVAFQITLSACRFLVIILMIATTAAAAVSSLREEDPYFVDVTDIQGADSFRFRGFYEMFSVMFYTTQFHLSVPVLSAAVQDKRQLGPIFRDGLVVCMVAFSLLGVILAWFFGDLIEQSANLNWNTFVGGHGDGFLPEATSAFILIFPALNVLSAYPLNAILLGNNLMALAYGPSITDAKDNRTVRVVFRFLASVPPIIGALFVRQLGTITSYAGLFGAVSALPIPAAMCVLSRRLVAQKGICTGTHYDSVGSSYGWARAIFIGSLVSLVYILLNLIIKQ